MCGITAVLSLTGCHAFNGYSGRRGLDAENRRKQDDEAYERQEPNPECVSIQEQVNGSLNAIKHRGPDSHGSWVSVDGKVALGSCRLEINDLSPTGNQPFQNADSTVHAVVNGELYDYRRIREEMINKTGYVFQGTSDCEIVVALYEYYGVAFVSHLRGEFALCLYDSKRQLFLAARDRSGVKPLFWTIVDNRLLLASEAKAFLPYGWQPDWDVRSIVTTAWLTEERTIFEGVQKVRPGYYMTCIGSAFITQRQYWDHDYPDKYKIETRNVEEMIEGVLSRLLEAVRIRLQADVPVGIHLSGGIDSAVIAGMAKHLLDTGQAKLGKLETNQQLQCLGVSFDKDSGYDESDIAKRTSDWLGVDFRTADMTESEFANNFEDATWYDEQIHGDLGFVGKHVLSKVTQDSNLKTILSGQGSDEIFGGYNFLVPDNLREPDLSWPDETPPEQWRKAESEKANQPAATSAKWGKLEAESLKPHISPQSMHEAPEWINIIQSAIQQPHFATWTNSLGQSSTAATVMEDISEMVRRQMRDKWHPLHSACYIWNKTFLPNALLTNLGDRTEMSHSVEGRVPFLDHRLMEYVNGLPPSLKFRYDPASKTLTEKWILKEASKPFVTKEIYDRKKHPYTSPVTYAVNGPMYKLLHRLVTKQNIEALGFIDWLTTEKVLQEGFEEQDPVKMRRVCVAAQFVVLGQKFGIKTARAH